MLLCICVKKQFWKCSMPKIIYRLCYGMRLTQLCVHTLVPDAKRPPKNACIDCSGQNYCLDRMLSVFPYKFIISDTFWCEVAFVYSTLYSPTAKRPSTTLRGVYFGYSSEMLILFLAVFTTSFTIEIKCKKSLDRHRPQRIR